MARGKEDPVLKAECIRLRVERQLNYNEIHELTGAPKSTLSSWLRDYPMSPEARVLALRRTPPVRPTKARGEESLLHRLMAGREYPTLQLARISETAVMLRLLLHNFAVFGSSFDGDVADWVVQSPVTHKLHSVQVKTVRKECGNGLPSVSLRNSRGRRYSEGDFDFIVGFSPFTDQAFVWTWDEVKHLKASVTIHPDALEAWDKIS